MELSSDVINGLKLIADTSKISDKYFVILLKNTVNSLVESKRFEPPDGNIVCKCHSSGRVHYRCHGSVTLRPYGRKIRPPNCYLPSATLALNLNLTLTPTLTFTMTPTLTLNLTLALSS